MRMSQNPYLTLEDLRQLKDAARFYIDYLIASGIRKEAPNIFEDARQANLHLLDFVQFWEQYPGLGDQIELKKPAREL